jgi:hypothetical protein
MCVSEENLSQDLSNAFDGVTDEAAEPVVEEAQELPPLEAPPTWAQEIKEKFTKTPREWQEFLLQRHKDTESLVTKRTQEAAQARKAWEQFSQTLAPYRTFFQREGMDDLGGIKFLLNNYAALRQDPEGTIKHLAQRYGVNLSQTQDQYVDPQVKALQDQIARLTAHVEQQGMSASEAQVQSLTNSVGQWSQAKDEAGNPKYPYFDEVVEDMVANIHALRNRGEEVSLDKLQDIYDRAVYANPSTRAKVLLAQKESEQKKLEEERKKKAAAARTAGFDVKGQGGVNVAPSRGDSIRADLEAAFGS